MNRGFSLIEILISVTILTSTLIAVALLTLGTPEVLANAVLHKEATRFIKQDFLREMARGPDGFPFISAYGNPINEFARTVAVDLLGDGSAKYIKSTVAWQTLWGVPQSMEVSGIATDYKNADQYACSPFLRRRATTESTLESFTTFVLPPIASLSANRTNVVIAASTTPGFLDPVLYVFKNESGNEGYLSFDSATSTKIGYVAVTVSGDYIYALSAHTCPTGIRCASLDVLSVTDTEILRVHSVPLSSARSIAYRSGYLYVGLRASSADPEFLVFSLGDPRHPIEVGNAEIGSTVNDIVSNGITAFMGTADNSIAGNKAVMAFSLSSLGMSMQPSMRMRPPGAGISQKLAVSGKTLYLGRSAPLNSKELYLLATENIAQELSAHDTDSSISGIVVLGMQAFVLTRTRLEKWSVEDPTHTAVSSSYHLPLGAVGSALECGGPSLFIAMNDSRGGNILRLGI